MRHSLEHHCCGTRPSYNSAFVASGAFFFSRCLFFELKFELSEYLSKQSPPAQMRHPLVATL